MGTGGHQTAAKDKDLQIGMVSESGSRTLAVLLKMTVVDLGTDTAGGKNVTNTQRES